MVGGIFHFLMGTLINITQKSEGEFKKTKKKKGGPFLYY